ncbi:LLM class flavin-dependent oxidoreductase [Pseudochryseolinea flava]|uniref:LLM class flavin-dependent oxidoreductase n=1 Tax=Pseudochryseolinea flava TaxID=2059302 RepID=UPI0026899619|nr:LLM class flavin-dependent oxidoreductase [Pseudochryseolinea flava]
MELGLYTFAELHPDPSTGVMLTPHQRMRNLMEEVALTEAAGLDVYAIGEHHRPDYIVSSPAVVLAAAAEKTKRIKLSSAVTVLSSDDPVRVFQDFATLDLLSGGRAEIMAGRGSFIESFPLFGYDLKDYDSLFSEKLELLMKINASTRVTWQGKHRAPLHNLAVYPRPHQQKLPIWVAIGGTPESVKRAATLGLPMALAIIGGAPARFAPYVEYYRETAQQSGHDPSTLGVSINLHGYIADDSQQAENDYYPQYAMVMNHIGRERGWPPLDREQFELQTSQQGNLLVGSPQQVIDKILYHHELFKHSRCLVQMSVGTLPHDKMCGLSNCSEQR